MTTGCECARPHNHDYQLSSGQCIGKLLRAGSSCPLDCQAIMGKRVRYQRVIAAVPVCGVPGSLAQAATSGGVIACPVKVDAAMATEVGPQPAMPMVLPE